MDAIAHACEALCCTRSNIYTEMICGKSLELSWKNLPIVYKEPHNMEARANMSLAAYLALTGESYGNCGHSMAHAIAPTSPSPTATAAPGPRPSPSTTPGTTATTRSASSPAASASTTSPPPWPRTSQTP